MNSTAANAEEPSAVRSAGPLLRVTGLTTHFVRPRGWLRPAQVVRAVEQVSFELHRGRTLGLVGESGCGKSTLARTILRLVPATAGRVEFAGHDVLALRARQLRRLRCEMQIVFQDPQGSLNPRMRVEQLIGEALHVHGLVRGAAARRRRVAELLERVGLPAAALGRYPHEFSGGQRQRIGIARALALRPKLVICDEPVSALDVSIQSQILNLLKELQQAEGLTYLFVAHHLGVVRHFCDEIAVMYVGRIVEQAPTEQLFRRPAHPYTQALLAAAPLADPARRMAAARIAGEPASPLAPPAGCAFHPRCPHAQPRCAAETPTLRELRGPVSQRVACHFAEALGAPHDPSADPAAVGN